MKTVFVSLLTFNNEPDLLPCLTALYGQTGLDALRLSIIDNGSTDGSASAAHRIVEDLKQQGGSPVPFEYKLSPLIQNFGFCGGHNFNARRFLDSDAAYFLVLNPDVTLRSDALHQMVAASKRWSDAVLITPKLFRQAAEVAAVEQTDTDQLLDAAGMKLTASLRHFDRGSNQSDTFFSEERVFGGTGACLFFSKSALKKILLRGERYDKDTFRLFPQLATAYDDRAPLFDEAFFAYREDAELCWRANHLGVQTIFAPSAVGYHVRKVLPTNRDATSELLNGLSVRNRFLLQINDYFFKDTSLKFMPALLCGFLLRNALVLAGVCLKERTSLPYLLNLRVILRRAYERRQQLLLLRKKN